MTSAAGTAPTVELARPPVLRSLRPLLAQWRGALALVGLLVLAAAAMELIPPLVLRNIVDRHLAVGDADGLRGLALLYLLAWPAMYFLPFPLRCGAGAGAPGVPRGPAAPPVRPRAAAARELLRPRGDRRRDQSLYRRRGHPRHRLLVRRRRAGSQPRATRNH